MFPELETISRRRKALGMSQYSLASEAGCTQSHLAKIERNKVIPSYHAARKIFEVLERAERRGEKTVGEIMHPSVISFDATQTVAEAVEAAKANGVSQFPILRRGQPVGCVNTKLMLGIEPSVQLARIMGPALPTVDSSTSINAVRPLLREEQPAVIVLVHGKIVGIVTAEDLL
jgi:predicted transcriptional regulator